MRYKNRFPLLPLHGNEANPELRFLPHGIELEILLEADILTWGSLQVESPKDLGEEQLGLCPGNGGARARPRPLIERLEGPGIIPVEFGIVRSVICRQPSLGAELERLGKVARVSRRGEVAGLADHL